MKVTDKLIGAGAVLLAFGGLGSAAAFASSPAQPAVHAKASVKKTVAPDHQTGSGHRARHYRASI